MNNKIPLIVLVALGVVLVIFLFKGPFFDSSQGVVTSIDITPKNPIQGDLVTVTVRATPNKSVPVTLYFSTNLTITNGHYEILLEGLRVPAPPNNFKVNALGVKDLSVAVLLGVWVTKSSKAYNGTASISQNRIPEGSYNVRIFGDASPGVSKVSAEIVAESSVTIGPDGNYIYSFDTAEVPPGSLKVVAGGESKSISLLSRDIG